MLAILNGKSLLNTHIIHVSKHNILHVPLVTVDHPENEIFYL